MSTGLLELQEVAQKNGEQIASLTKGLDVLVKRLEKMPAPGTTPQQVFGAPWVRHGEDPMSSRGFSFCKMIGVLSGGVPREDAKIELDVADRLNNVFCKELGSAGYDYKGGGQTGLHRFLCPLATGFMQEKIVPREFRQEMKALVAAGTDGADYDEMRRMRTKMYAGQYGNKALSWVNELTGGAIVAPPEQGELIELLRNKEALVNAGARVVPLPPQGRLKYPRQTAASTTYWIGENAPITESTVGTGEVTLQAKKLAVLIKAPRCGAAQLAMAA